MTSRASSRRRDIENFHPRNRKGFDRNRQGGARFLGSYKLKVIPLIYVKHFAKATLTILKEIKPFLFEQNSRFYLSTILYIINVGNMSD